MSSTHFRTIILAVVSALVCCVSAHAMRWGDNCKIINTDYAIGKSCQCALRDSYGFLWLGTASGIYAFDSNGSLLYPTPHLTAPSLPDVTALFEHDGNIWAGASNGLWVYDVKRNTNARFPFRTKYGVAVSSPVQKIMQVSDGRIWILTYGQGLFIFNTKDNTLEQNSRNGAFYSDMTVGANGNVYAVSLDGELKVFNSDGGFIESIALPEFAAGHNSLRIVAGPTEITISSGKTIYTYDAHDKQLTVENPKNLTSGIKSMCQTSDGIVLGTDEGLLFYDRNTGSVTSLASTKNPLLRNHLSDDDVTCVMNDADESILVLTMMGGVSHIVMRPQPVGMIELGTTDDPVPATAVCVSDDGKHVWVGSRNGVVCLDTPSLTPTALDISGVDGDDITSIAAKGDILWIGTASKGCFRYDRSTGATRHYVYDADVPNSLISNKINKIHITGKGEIFILSSWGVCRYNEGGDDFSTFGDIDSHKQPLTLAEDRHGRIWLVMSDGSIYTREQNESFFRHFISKNLSDKSVILLHCDHSGTLIAAVNDNKVYTFDEAAGDFVPYRFEVSTTYPLIFIERDLDGRLWLGDASGALASVNSDKRMEYFLYKANAYSDIFAASGVSGLLDDGRIVYGDLSGLRIFNPREMKSSDSRAHTYLWTVFFPYIDNGIEEQQRLGVEGMLCDRDTLTLPYNDNTFTLMFAASHGGNMPPLRFRYRLEGVDKEWLTISEPNVTYTKLQPGTYTLSILSETEPEETARTLTITVAPPWYRTITAYIFYFFLTVALGWMLWIVIRRRVRKHYQKRINDMRLQKERETFEAKMQFFVNLVHEIRTPLTLISLPLEQMAENARAGKAKTEDNRKHIKSMRRNVNYLLGIVNQLLDFRKAQSGSEVQLKRSITDINKLISDIAGRFAHPMATAGKTFELIMPDVVIKADVDVDKIERVVMNIVSNAMKYSRTKVVLELCPPAEGEFAIKVSDDGTGIPADERERIFDTYYQISGDNVAATLGTGLGLAYAKLIANAHHGSITVDNNATGGATFTIILNAATTTEAEQPARVELIADNSEEDTEDKQDITILLVDDNKELLTTVSEALSQSYGVLTAASGEEALDILGANPDIDFIISDFMMPGISGARLCQRVKNDIRFSHIPFIMLTAKTDREAKEEGMEAGVDVYVEKPFTIKQIKLQIANILKTRAIFYHRMLSELPQQEAIATVPYINKLDTEFLETLNANIADNICDEEFSIDTMAERMNMSRSSFYRKLKAVTGMTPVDYLKNFRLEHAARLLLEGARITEVALMSGFTSSSYFSKCFKAKYGQNPKDYASSRQSSGMSQNG